MEKAGALMGIPVIIADDVDLTLQGMAAVLGSSGRYDVRGTARSLDNLLVLLKREAVAAVVMNEWLYSTDILSAVEKIRVLCPDVAVIVMGGLLDGLLIRDLFDVGVKGYLYKADDLCQLLPLALDTVLRNRPYLSPTASAEYLIALQKAEPDTRLTPEFRRVLQGLATGANVDEIALQIGISKRRVYWIRAKLRQRFRAQTNEHLIQRAATEGFIYPGE